MPLLQGVGGSTLVALLATEQGVCAVEDQALREVALGGPDSAARARLMQQFLRLPLHGSTCADAARDQRVALGGRRHDRSRHIPAALVRATAGRLRAAGGQADPCTPAAPGGYLGADNQLVRVTVRST